MNIGKIMIAASAGLAAGILIGILVAPDKGSETIKKIKDNAGGQIKDLLNGGIEAVKDKLLALGSSADGGLEKFSSA